MLLERRYRMGKRNVDRLRYISHNECGRGMLLNKCNDYVGMAASMVATIIGI